MSFGAMAGWQALLLITAAGAVAAWLFLLKIRPPRVNVPLIEGISAGILLAEALVRLGLEKPALGSLQPLPLRETVGLRPALSARLGQGG